MRNLALKERLLREPRLTFKKRQLCLTAESSRSHARAITSTPTSAASTGLSQDIDLIRSQGLLARVPLHLSLGRPRAIRTPKIVGTAGIFINLANALSLGNAAGTVLSKTILQRSADNPSMFMHWRQAWHRPNCSLLVTCTLMACLHCW